MALTKKHFTLVADEIRDEINRVIVRERAPSARADAAIDALRSLAYSLCGALRAENPKFDSERFLRACGF